MAMDTNMKQLEKSKETHNVYLQMFICTPSVTMQTSGDLGGQGKRRAHPI
jgi:hypothetical protein